MKKLLYTLIITIVSISLFAQTKINIPVLVAPVDSAVFQMPDVLLDWNPVSGVGEVSYEVQLDNDSSFPNPEIFNVSVTSLETEELFFSKSYFWKVRATDNTGTSEWSSVFKFTVMNSMVLNDPDNGSSGEYPNVKLKWFKYSGGYYGTPFSGFTYVDCQVDTSFFWSVDNQVPVAIDLNSVYFLDANNGYAVGDDGVIIHYDGLTWNVETTPDNWHLYDIYMFSNIFGIAVGEYGRVISYTAGVWEVVADVPTDKSLSAVSAVDANNIWVVGNSGTILYADASGYVLQESPTTKDLKGVFAVSANDVWAVGKSGTIIHYDGTEWTKVTSPSTNNLSDVFFTDASNGWAVGEESSYFQHRPILHYDGAEWTEVVSDVDFDLESLYMLNENMGMAVGNSGYYALFNGSSWSPMTSGTKKDLYSVFMLDEDNVWLVGEDGTVVSWTGNAFNSPAAQIHTTTIDVTKVAMSQLFFDTKYFWRVRARHDLDTSEWSEARYFSTIDKVTLTEPANNSSDNMLGVLLKWQKVSGTHIYIYEVCRDSNFSIPWISFSDVNQASAQGLMYDSTYYWRVKAAHTKDTTNWSEVWSFTTINTVNLVSPNNGDTTGTSPFFTWEGQTGTDGYVVEYDLSDGFENAEPVIVDAPTTSCNVIYPLEKGMTYYWRVKAFHDGDTTGWSEVRHFLTEPEQGVDDYLAENTVSVFPNPAKDEFSIAIQTVERVDVDIIVLNLLGKEIISDNFIFEQGANTRKINVRNIENGVYILQLESNGNIFSRKLIIDK